MQPGERKRERDLKRSSDGLTLAAEKTLRTPERRDVRKACRAAPAESYAAAGRRDNQAKSFAVSLVHLSDFPCEDAARGREEGARAAGEMRYLLDGQQKRDGQDEQEPELEEELARDGVQHLVVHGVHEVRVEGDVELRVPVRFSEKSGQIS